MSDRRKEHRRSSPATEREIVLLNKKFESRGAEEVLEAVFTDHCVGRPVIVSSFGAESAVLLHLASAVDQAVPIIFLDTGKHFPETLDYMKILTARLGLRGVRIVRPDPAALKRRDPKGFRWSFDPETCCQLRKVLPLSWALADYDASVTGRKAFQAATRRQLRYFDLEDGKVKVNPLVRWSKDEIDRHFINHGLPRHPLEREGYLSIGCAPCTSKVLPGEDPRSGRWRGLEMTECGIHMKPGGGAGRTQRRK